MKRHGNLFLQITAFENLLIAAKKAQKGKRYQRNVLAFNDNLENELFQLQETLNAKTYQPGAYTTFEIKEPKPRLISAAPYQDRVVHHALCNIIAPIFERTFVTESYANRFNFGTHKALQRFIEFARSHRYLLQCDIQKYFPSIDHAILKSLIRRKIKCPNTLWLVDTIIDNSNEQIPAIAYFQGDDLLSPLNRRHGLPIGNLTSQFFANVYLNGFDHFVKEKLKISQYVRYVDDFALFSDDYDLLKKARLAIEDYLVTLRLKIHPIKSQLTETKQGASFLGFRVLPHRIRVRNENLKRARKRLRNLQTDFAQGKMTIREVSQSIRSWVAHLEHGNTWRLREKIFEELHF
ncbi:RNA-directed DNA polymerase [Candidatus Parabeggiatoa sp. HSG14]|uniref:RNA-directed DNA polymerase n=1 Tax=Candidatus Parabeggiatoa sp. HSG14 TaxID=3055593 RepID=UPI0025A8DEE6|nr:RNA-directed DNA polymerase [Thiotrichales bacterium HSG14]